MAEALSGHSIPVSSFQSIAVATEKDKRQVEAILKECKVAFPWPYVDVRSVWFQ